MDTKKCPYCGKQIHTEAQYCMYCMSSLTSKKNISPETSHRSRWIVVCLILCVIAVLSLTFYAYNRNNEVIPKNISDTQQSYTEPLNVPADVTNEKNTEDQTVMSDTAQMNDTEAESTSPQETENIPTTMATLTTEPVEIQTETTVEEHTIPTTQILCQHYYLAATCLKPMTCTFCGDTYGDANLNAHQWEPNTVTIHHDEVGHYEEKQVSYKKTVYLCFFCGYNKDEYDSMDDLREHITVHKNLHNYDLLVSILDSITDTREVWETKTEIQWVVDEKAYDETVLVGYVCTLCNAKKDP